MTVKNVQDVMLAAVAVSGMKGTDVPDANTPEVPSLVTGAAPAEEVAAANAPEEQWAEE